MIVFALDSFTAFNRSMSTESLDTLSAKKRMAVQEHKNKK
jgi:hypothetical protein